jgi:hypothetical protein
LPQRGLVPRQRRRSNEVAVVSIKANPENVPEFCLEPAWESFMSGLGLLWRPDTPRTTDGSDQSWHDFSEVDAVITMRSEQFPGDERKPPTRLINAWRAGVIPLANDEPAVRELARDFEDTLIVRSRESLEASLQSIVRDPGLRKRLFEGSRQRGKDFDPTSIVRAWIGALEEAANPQRPARTIIRRWVMGIRLLPRAAMRVAIAATNRAVNRIRRSDH